MVHKPFKSRFFPSKILYLEIIVGFGVSIVTLLKEFISVTERKKGGLLVKNRFINLERPNEVY